MFGGAAFAGLVEGFVPGTPQFPVLPGLVALAVACSLLIFRRRLHRPWLVLLGPWGVVLIAYSLGLTRGDGDGAVLYAWPVLWTAHFYGRRATCGILVTVGVAHALALRAMPAGIGYPSRWIDVMVSMAVIAVSVRLLTENNDRLVAGLAGEARIDPLTGLLNRRGMDERAEIELRRADRDQLVVSVIALDIDHFKAINDDHGHAAGDQVLTRLGALLNEQIRGSDIAARVGGEEFMLVLTGPDERRAAATAERIRALAATIAISGVPAFTISAGVTATTAPKNITELIAAADRALYEAKRGGRDRMVIGSPDLQETRALNLLHL